MLAAVVVVTLMAQTMVLRAALAAAAKVQIIMGLEIKERLLLVLQILVAGVAVAHPQQLRLLHLAVPALSSSVINFNKVENGALCSSK
jgi:hypothetical protein